MPKKQNKKSTNKDQKATSNSPNKSVPLSNPQENDLNSEAFFSETMAIIRENLPDDMQGLSDEELKPILQGFIDQMAEMSPDDLVQLEGVANTELAGQFEGSSINPLSLNQFIIQDEEDDEDQFAWEEQVKEAFPAQYVEANQLVSEAMEEATESKRTKMLLKATKMCPGCVVAWTELGDGEPVHHKAVEFYRRAVENASWMLEAGKSWPIAEAVLSERYIFDLLQVANSYWRIGERDEAIKLHEQLDQLNDLDLCAHRLHYAFRLFEIGDSTLLAKQIEKLQNDSTSQSAISYLNVLTAYRDSLNSEQAKAIVIEAHEENPLVAKYLFDGYDYPDVDQYDEDSDEFSREEESHWVAAAVTAAARPYENFLRWVRDTIDYTPAPVVNSPEAVEEELDLIAEYPQNESIWILQTESKDDCFYVVVYDYLENELIEVEADDEAAGSTRLWEILTDSMSGGSVEDSSRPAKIVVHQPSLAGQWKARCRRIDVEIECDPELKVPDSLIEELHDVMMKVEEDVRVTPQNIELAKQKDRSDQVWHVGIFQPPIWIHDASTPRRSSLAIVIDEESEQIRIHDLSGDKPTPDFLAKTVLKGILFPLSGDDDGVLPEKILVHPHTNIEMIRSLAEELNIQLDRLDDEDHQLLDSAIMHLIIHCSDASLRESLSSSAELEVDEIRTLYKNCSRFFEAAPWQKVPTDHLIRISCPLFRHKHYYASIIGQSGIHCGMVLSFDGLGMKAMMDDKLGKSIDFEMTLLNFGEQHEIAPIDLWTIEQFDCDVNNLNAYPTIQQSLSSHQYRRPNRDSILALDTAMQVIPLFLNDPTGRESMSVDIESLHGQATVQVEWFKI